ADMEASGESLGLERHQELFRASSPLPTPTHRIPYLDGGCGMESMIKVLEAIGGEYKQIHRTANQTIATVSIARTIDHEQEKVAQTTTPEGTTSMAKQKQAEPNGQQQIPPAQEPQQTPPLYELKLNGVQADVRQTESERGTFFSVSIFRNFTGRDGT